MEHGPTYIALGRDTKLSQITLISTITSTRMKSLNNHLKIGPRVEHVADLLRSSILTKEGLRRVSENT